MDLNQEYGFRMVTTGKMYSLLIAVAFAAACSLRNLAGVCLPDGGKNETNNNGIGVVGVQQINKINKIDNNNNHISKQASLPQGTCHLIP